MLINPTEIARKMPELVKSIQETNLAGIYGEQMITEFKWSNHLIMRIKNYIFHRLTHALQTSRNGIEQCGFYNGNDGMFLTEGIHNILLKCYIMFLMVSMQHRQQQDSKRS